MLIPVFFCLPPPEAPELRAQLVNFPRVMFAQLATDAPTDTTVLGAACFGVPRGYGDASAAYSRFVGRRGRGGRTLSRLPAKLAWTYCLARDFGFPATLTSRVGS